MPKAPPQKVYLTKAAYERDKYLRGRFFLVTDHGKGAFERLYATSPRAGGGVRTAPYTVGGGRGGQRGAGQGRGGSSIQQQGRGGGQQQRPGGAQGPRQGGGQQQQQRQQHQPQRLNQQNGGRGRSTNAAYMDQDEDEDHDAVANERALPQRKGASGKNATAVATAKVLVASGNHPKRTEIKQLLQAYERGWVSDDRFAEALSSLIM